MGWLKAYMSCPYNTTLAWELANEKALFKAAGLKPPGRSHSGRRFLEQIPICTPVIDLTIFRFSYLILSTRLTTY